MNECKIAFVLFVEDPFKPTTTKQTVFIQTPLQLRNWKTDESDFIKQQITHIRNIKANVECFNFNILSNPNQETHTLTLSFFLSLIQICIE
jgi:hypothetical protein